MSVQDVYSWTSSPPVIVYRPQWYGGAWFAWVARDPGDAHKPGWARRLDWWPVSEAAALAWLQAGVRRKEYFLDARLDLR